MNHSYSNLNTETELDTASITSNSLQKAPDLDSSLQFNLDNEFLNSTCDSQTIISEVASENCQRGWQRIRSHHKDIFSVEASPYSSPPKFELDWCPHTTSQSLKTAEVITKFYELLAEPLSPIGKQMLKQTLTSSRLSIQERLIRQNSVRALSKTPELINQIHEFAHALTSIKKHNKEELQNPLRELSGLAAKLSTGCSDPLVSDLLGKITSYFEREVVRDFLALDFNCATLPDRFSKRNDSKIRYAPIYDDQANFALGLATISALAIGCMLAATSRSGFNTSIIGFTAIPWSPFFAFAARENWYQQKVDTLFANYSNQFFNGKEFEDLVGAVATLEELSALGKLAAHPSARMPTFAADGSTLSLNQLIDPIAILSGVQTVPIDIELQPGKPLLLNGQNGGGKTYACGAIIRSISSAAMGGPVSAIDAVLPDFAFWAMQSPKQEANGNQGRLGSEADTTSVLIERAQAAKGAALLFFDEVGQGTSQEGTEEVTKRALGETAACAFYVVHPTHELPLARRMYRRNQVDALRVKNSGISVTHGFEPGVAEKSGAFLIAEKVGYSEGATRRRVRNASGNLNVFEKWAETARELAKKNDA